MVAHVVVEEVVVAVEAVATTVESQVTCLATALKVDQVAAVVVAAAIEPATTVVKLDISRVNVPTKGVEAVVTVTVQTRANATTAMDRDISPVTVQKEEEVVVVVQTETAWSATSAVRLVILLVTAPTALVEVEDHVDTVVVVVEDPVHQYDVTTATRPATSLAIAQLSHRRSTGNTGRAMTICWCNCQLKQEWHAGQSVRAIPRRSLC